MGTPSVRFRMGSKDGWGYSTGALPGRGAGTLLETFYLSPDDARLLFQRRTLFLYRSDRRFYVFCRCGE